VVSKRLLHRKQQDIQRDHDVVRVYASFKSRYWWATKCPRKPSAIGWNHAVGSAIINTEAAQILPPKITIPYAGNLCVKAPMMGTRIMIKT